MVLLINLIIIILKAMATKTLNQVSHHRDFIVFIVKWPFLCYRR